MFRACRFPFLAAIVVGVVACQTSMAQRPPIPRGRPTAPGEGSFGPEAPKPEELGPKIADPDEQPPKADRRYKEIPLTKAEENKYKRQLFNIRRILMAGKFDGNREMFDEFMKRYFLGRWTLWDNRPSLPGFRKDLRNFFRQAKSGEVYDHLNALVLEFMNDLAHGEYNMAARVNAVLAIGELNGVEAGVSSPAVPYPRSLEPLLDAVGGADSPDAIRAAAMVGVLRHAEAGIGDENVRRSVSEAMLRLATADPPTGPSASGREWILAQAVEALGLLGSTGDGNRVFEAISGVVSDSRLSDRTRCVGAAALGHLNYAGAAGIDPLKGAAKLARFIADCCAEEVRWSKEAAQPVSRRRIKQRLEAALTALGGVGGGRKGIVSLAGKPEQQTLLAEMQKSIKDLADLLDDRRSEEQDMAPPIDELRGKLEAWLGKLNGEGGGN
ncbi:MAG: hypothetical protein JW959_10630 [Pirellulales bacterium]|nr:hypothetical protein [Pirellulales bacterium]